MSGFNLSAWALRNRTLVLYAMVVLAIAGFFSYQRLGQSEDPPFTFKIMVVRTMWPGATAEEVAEQVTDRVEQSLAAILGQITDQRERRVERTHFLAGRDQRGH